MRRYLFNLFLATDQWLGAALGGDNPDETISSAIGRKSLEGRLWARLAGLPIDGLFWLVAGQRRHCLASIEWTRLSPDQITNAMHWLGKDGREFLK